MRSMPETVRSMKWLGRTPEYLSVAVDSFRELRLFAQTTYWRTLCFLALVLSVTLVLTTPD
jgi:hypothetical protein